MQKFNLIMQNKKNKSDVNSFLETKKLSCTKIQNTTSNTKINSKFVNLFFNIKIFNKITFTFEIDSEDKIYIRSFVTNKTINIVYLLQNNSLNSLNDKFNLETMMNTSDKINFVFFQTKNNNINIFRSIIPCRRS